ncbi:hypothetical protein DEJ27_00050 [Curtobacterium sp. MCPF17_018]|nr:hypothetical protein DEJ27_00050 [Curtobacterium sp. MCPF17_018]
MWGPSFGDELEAAGALSAFDAAEQRSRDDSLAECLKAEPTLLGEPLMVVGTSVLTKDGDVVDVLALNERGATQVISVGNGIASVETIGNVLGQGAWVDELDDAAFRDIFDAHHQDETFDESFQRHFGEHVPVTLNGARVLTVVTAGLDDAAERVPATWPTRTSSSGRSATRSSSTPTTHTS